MIPQRELSLLSNRLAERGGRRIPETVLERDYCLSWFLVGLSPSPLRDRLAFKGGTALKTRLWAALQQASGGTWAGCVYDVDRIVAALEAGLELTKGVR